MLSDVIKKYGGEKMDPLDVYKDIFRIGEGWQKYRLKATLRRTELVTQFFFFLHKKKSG